MCFFYTLSATTSAIVVEKANYVCRVFWSKTKKQEAVICFRYRARILQSVLSKVQSNCPKRFVVIIFEGLQLFFWNGGLIFDDWSVRITFYVCRGSFCREKWFLWKLSWKSSEDVVESEFHVCGDMLWEKIPQTFKETFFSCWTKVLSTCSGEQVERISKNKKLLPFLSVTQLDLFGWGRQNYITCAGYFFLGKKREAMSFFGYCPKRLQPVLSKVHCNCRESFVGKCFERLQFSSIGRGLIFDNWCCQNSTPGVQRNTL